MNWEEITSPDFSAARESCGGVCLLPMGVLEKHGTHLPLGTDGLSAHELCVRAASRESAMVFPEYYFGSIAEARQHPGTVALPFALILELLEAVCDEISRNGFKKIILVNAHGGNTSLLDALSLTMLKKQKDYMVYYRRIAFLMDHPMMESRQEWHGHADEGETSIMMELFPELVRNHGVPGAGGTRRKYAGHLDGWLPWTSLRRHHPRLSREGQGASGTDARQPGGADPMGEDAR